MVCVTEDYVMLNLEQILTRVRNSVPESFETLEPEQKTHFLVKGIVEAMEQECELIGNYLLLNGDMTIIQLLTDNSESK